ncbi:MAG TPA: glutamine amidotransferase [Desulfosporosinus sp.]|nr:glutamine amidotransferase [Desulfosporosinus sp.]
MCGIAGVISKNKMDISSGLISMLNLIQHRGSDASGIAVYGLDDNITLRTTMKSKDLALTLMETIANYATVLGEQISDWSRNLIFSEMRLEISAENIPKLHEAINKVPGLTVHSIGKGMKVYKEGGLIGNLIRNNSIDCGFATHGIGHVRMATESAEDINAAHPFVSPFYPEIAIVHNGQFTNYFNMRRFLEAKGATFKTMNDSEAASHLIAYAMRENGGDLKAALDYALEVMDGVFCIIAATSTQLGFVKDKLGIKPMLLFETDNLVMFGSEQIEFTAIADDVFADEMDPGEVRVWNV